MKALQEVTPDIRALGIINHAMQELKLLRDSILAGLPVVSEGPNPNTLIDPTTGKPFRLKRTKPRHKKGAL